MSGHNPEAVFLHSAVLCQDLRVEYSLKVSVVLGNLLPSSRDRGNWRVEILGGQKSYIKRNPIQKVCDELGINSYDEWD